MQVRSGGNYLCNRGGGVIASRMHAITTKATSSKAGSNRLVHLFGKKALWRASHHRSCASPPLGLEKRMRDKATLALPVLNCRPPPQLWLSWLSAFPLLSSRPQGSAPSVASSTACPSSIGQLIFGIPEQTGRAG